MMPRPPAPSALWLPFLNSPKDLDPSHKIVLEGKKLSPITKEMQYCAAAEKIQL